MILLTKNVLVPPEKKIVILRTKHVDFSCKQYIYIYTYIYIYIYIGYMGITEHFVPQTMDEFLI